MFLFSDKLKYLYVYTSLVGFAGCGNRTHRPWKVSFCRRGGSPIPDDPATTDKSNFLIYTLVKLLHLFL